MAITMRELALLQAEVLNAASLALAVLALSETGLAEQARAVGCGERCRPTHTHTTTTTSPARSDHSSPFLAYPALGNITFICIEPPAPSYTARDTFVDALHRSGCPGKETRDKCARVKESDRIPCSDDPVTSPYTSFHRAAVSRPNYHQEPYPLVRQTTPSCANE